MDELTLPGTLGIPLHPWLQRVMSRTSIHEYKFFDTSIDNHVENAFQALALDEHRAAFWPTVWERPDGCTTVRSSQTLVPDSQAHVLTEMQNLKQVWFPGVHTNVGGGQDDTSTADISLAWMMDQLSGLSPGVEFHKDYLMDQWDLNQKTWYKKQKWRWGHGQLADSNTFPTSLGGSQDRTPDLYHQTEYDSGRPKDTMLRNTRELVHASVRARCRYGGANHDGKTPYSARGLKDWRLSDSQRDGDNWGPKVGSTGVSWVYCGTDHHGQGKVMSEDTIGSWERKLLAKDSEMESRILGPSDVGVNGSADV